MSVSLKDRLEIFEKKQFVASALGLLVLVCLAIVFNYIHLSRQAEQTAKFISRMIQIEDFREVGVTLQTAKLDHFSVIRYISTDSRRSFTLPELAELMPDHSFWRKLTHDEVTVDVATASFSHDKIVFEFGRFAEVGWAFLIWAVLNLVSIPQTRLMKKRIVEGFDESLKIETELARAEVARRLRHNIRTPLSALMRLSARKGPPDVNEALLANVISHIKNLVSDLDEPGRRNAADNLFHPVLTNAMREVRLVSPGRLTVTTEVDDSLISAHGNFVSHELRSIVSNVVTNAFEATQDGGKVDIIARDFGDRVFIEITDNGKGIPVDVLGQVTEKGFSHGKPSGTGIGLYHAKDNIENWGGDLRISSKLGFGTTIHIMLPICARESWYVPRIRLRQTDMVVIVDDQASMHDVWKERLVESGFLQQPKFFASGDAALSFLENPLVDKSRKVVFADYDLGARGTGFDVLLRAPHGSELFLVTGHFDDEIVQAQCKAHQIALIPKTAVNDIPIVVV